jgi:acyl-CoA synthetase (AMP-forming)/AMP-acid ligase II
LTQDFLENQNVCRFLARMARDHPQSTAVIQPALGKKQHQEFSFSEFSRLVAGVTAYLRNRGIKRGCRTILLVRPGLELIVIAFALFQTGAIPIVIDPGMGLKKFRACVARSKPRALIGIPLTQAIALFFPAEFRSLTIRVWAGKHFLHQFRNACDTTELEPAHAKPKDLAAILFTSGSTGPPKGVCYEHRHFDAQVRLVREQYGINPGEVDLPLLPIFALFNPALGMTTVVPPVNPAKPAKADPAKIVHVLSKYNVTNSFGSPVLWKIIGQHCAKHDIRLPTLRRILMAGASAPPDLVRLWTQIAPNAKIHTPYGATECLPVCSIDAETILSSTAEKTQQGFGTCLGQVVPGMQVRILPFREVPQKVIQETGEIGEIIVSGPVVTTAYDRLPEATEAAKIKDDQTIWHRMGDLGYIDGEKRLWFCGRVAERVLTAKGPLHTDCCEAIFNQHPKVFRSALIGIGEIGKQHPAIVIEPEKVHFPKLTNSKKSFRKELLELANASPVTRGINTFFFHPSFPVDVRHNAKIHRLTLAKIFANDLTT